MSLKTLIKPRYENPDPAIRRKAVSSLTDKDKLAKIAREDESAEVRLAAVEKIYDQDLLADIAITAKYDDVRLSAVDKITDQSILADIIRKRKNYEMTIAALAKITDKEIIAHIAKSDQYNIATRRIAIDMFADQSMLIDVARKISLPKVKKEAIDKIENDRVKQSMMAEIKHRHILSEEELQTRLDTIVESYGEEQAVETLGKLTGSIHAVRSLGILAKKGGDTGEKAISYLEKAVKHHNPEVADQARKILQAL